MTEIYITSESGTLVAEVKGEKRYELTDAIYALGFGFGDFFTVHIDDDDANDAWSLIDAMYEEYAD